jgi:lysozyme
MAQSKEEKQIESYKSYISKNEGLRLLPYKDSLGHLTIGIGHNLDKGLDLDIIMQIFEKDFDIALTAAKTFSWFDKLNDARKMAIVDMIFNLGRNGVAGFKKMIKAIEEDDYFTASKEIKNSKYAKQLPTRAKRNAWIMLSGVA